MAVKTTMIGADKIIKNLLKSTTDVGDGSLKGLTKGGLKVNKESKEEAPSDLGNLRSSGFMVTPKSGDVSVKGTFKGKGKVKAKAATQHKDFVDSSSALVGSLTSKNLQAVAVGFSAPYALPVHENPRTGHTGGVTPSGKKRKTFSEVGKWKFLEDPLKRNGRNIVNDLAKAIKL